MWALPPPTASMTNSSPEQTLEPGEGALSGLTIDYELFETDEMTYETQKRPKEDTHGSVEGPSHRPAWGSEKWVSCALCLVQGLDQGYLSFVGLSTLIN